MVFYVIILIFLMVLFCLLIMAINIMRKHAKNGFDKTGTTPSPFTTEGFVEIENQDGSINIERQRVYSSSYIKSLADNE